uniref:Microtubule-associated protein futsch n=1 Tax=Cacopsylla melanoneura TaxID=428564 RepID=A0A8D8UBL5_9HEMI
MMAVPDPGPPSLGLCGGYLLLIIGEPHSAVHKNVILSRIKSGLLSWNEKDCGVNLESELSAVVSQGLEGEVSKNGERLIQHASDCLVTEILVHPQLSTVAQCIRNLLGSMTQHKQVVYAGYTFTGNGSWVLQDGIFTLSNLISIFHEPEVKSILQTQHEQQISINIHASSEGEGDWNITKMEKEYFFKMCRITVNSTQNVIPAESTAITSFLNYLNDLVEVQTVEDILPPTQIVGNIRFTHPTLYVFPGGHGDAALFGINGFNMLIDGGFGRKACFWDFIRHLDRVDAMLMTRINKTNVNSLANVVRRKKQSNIHPQVGHFFCNLQDRKHPTSPDTDNKESLLIDVLLEGQEMISNLKSINLKPQPCYRDANMEPINLYHKVGYGKLDMYVISPARDSREVKEFLMKWHSNDTKLFSGFNKKTTFPIQNLVSICALLVWQPANPNETITRLLFPGSAPQYKIFEGLEKIKHLEFLKYPVCTSKSLNTNIVTNRSSSKTRTTKADAKAGDDLVTKTNKLIEDLTKENVLKPEISKELCNEENESKKVEEKEKSAAPEKKKVVKREVKARVDSKITKKKEIKDAKDSKDSDKSSPTTPKKSFDAKMNGIIKASRIKNKSSPSATPTKTAKEEVNNKKVAETKKSTTRTMSTARTKSSTRTKETKEEATKPYSVPKKVPRRPIEKKDDKKANMKLDNIKNEKAVLTDSSTVSTPSAMENTKELKDHIAASKVTKEMYKITTSVQPDKGETDGEDEIMTIEKVEQDGEVPVQDEVVAESEDAKEDENVKEDTDVKEQEEEVHGKTDEDVKEPEATGQEVESKPALNLDLNLTKEDQDIVKDDALEETKDGNDDVKEEPEYLGKDSSVVKKKDKSGSELSSDEIGKGMQKDSDDKKDEKIISTVESGQTTTAPTLPEDERIPLDEIKEEKVNVDSTAGKKVDMKREIHMSKIHTGIVKTPDEVADLPVHEEVDATDYEDIEKKDEGIDEEMEDEGEEQEGSTDIMKGSISFITTTRESDDLLNEDGDKPAEKTDDDIDKITNDEKLSEDSKDILDKQSKERLNAEKVKPEQSADEPEEKVIKDVIDIKEEGDIIGEKLEKDLKNTAILREVTKDEIETENENEKDQEAAKDAAIVEDPVYGKLKPDHAEFVTITPDSAPDSPKKTGLSSIQEAKSTNENTDKDVAKKDTTEDLKQETIPEEKKTISEEKKSKEDVEEQEQECIVIKDKIEGSEIEVTSIENEQTVVKEIDTIEKLEIVEKRYIETNEEQPTIVETSKENMSSSKSPEDKTIVTPAKSDTKEDNDEIKLSLNDNVHEKTKSSETQIEKETEIKVKKKILETKEEQERTNEAGSDTTDVLPEDKSEKAEEKEDLKQNTMVPETDDSKLSSRKSSVTEDKIGLDPTRIDLNTKSNDTKSDLTVSDKGDINHVDVHPHDPSVKSIEEEEDQGTPPKSPSDRVDSRKTSTESLGNKSTTESILSAEHTEDLDKDQTLSNDPKLSSIELKMSEENVEVPKSEDAAAESTGKELLDEKLDVFPKNNTGKDVSLSKSPEDESKLSTLPKSPNESSSKSSPSKSQTDEASQIKGGSPEPQKTSLTPSKSPTEISEEKSVIEDKPTSPNKSPIETEQSKTDKQMTPPKSPETKSLLSEEKPSPPKSPIGNDEEPEKANSPLERANDVQQHGSLPKSDGKGEKENATLQKSPEKVKDTETVLAFSEKEKDTEKIIPSETLAEKSKSDGNQEIPLKSPEKHSEAGTKGLSPLESSKGSENIASPPKSPSEKLQPSKESEKVSSPPKSPTDKVELSNESGNLPTPPKSPTEKVDLLKGPEKAPCPLKSLTDKNESSTELEKAGSPPKTPTEKGEPSKESEKLQSPPKSPVDKVEPLKDSAKSASPPKSPIEKLELAKESETFPSPPKSPNLKVEPFKESEKPPSHPESPTEKGDPSKNSKMVGSPPKSPIKELQKAASPPKSPAEKIDLTKESEKHESPPKAPMDKEDKSKDLSPLEISKESEKVPSPSNLPIEKVESSKEAEKGASPPKSPTDKLEPSMGTEKESSSPKSLSKEPVTVPSPPKSPTKEVNTSHVSNRLDKENLPSTLEKEEDTEKLTSPPKSPVGKSKELFSASVTTLEKLPSPLKSPIEKSKDEKIATLPKSPEKSLAIEISASKNISESPDKSSELKTPVDPSDKNDSQGTSPKSPKETSTDADKKASPPKSPENSATEKLQSPAKSTEESAVESAKKLPSPPKSPLDVSKEEQETITPSKTPTELCSDTKIPPPSILPSETASKNGENVASPPKSPIEKTKESVTTSINTTTANTSETTTLLSPSKQAGDFQNVTVSGTPTEKILEVDETKTSSKVSSEVTQCEIQPKPPVENSVGVEKIPTPPPKSPIEKQKEQEKITPPRSPKDSILPTIPVEDINTNALNLKDECMLQGDIHSKVEVAPKKSSSESDSSHKGITIMETSNQLSNIDESTPSKLSSSDETKISKKDTEEGSTMLSSILAHVSNGISSSVAEVVDCAADMSSKIIEDVEHFTGLELDISKATEKNDLVIEKTDEPITSEVMSLGRESCNLKTDQKTDVEIKAVDISSTNDSQSTSATVKLDQPLNNVEVIKEKLYIEKRKDSKSSPTISVTGSPERKENLVLREMSLEKTLSSTSSMKDEDSRKTTPALSPSISINGSPVKDIDKLTKEFSLDLKQKSDLEETIEIKPTINGNVAIVNGSELDDDKEISSQLTDALVSGTSPSSSRKSSTADDKPKMNDTYVTKKSNEKTSLQTVTVTATIESAPITTTSAPKASDVNKSSNVTVVDSASPAKSDTGSKVESKTEELDTNLNDAIAIDTQETPDPELIRSRMMPMRTSYIGAGDSSRSDTPDSRLDDIEDDTPYSPVSVTSSYSPPPEMMSGRDTVDHTVLDNMTTSVIDHDMSASIMMSSFYGTLPGSEDNEGNIAFERALDEHRSVRGNDLLTDNASATTTTTSVTTLVRDANGNANIRHNVNEQESAFIGQSDPPTVTSTVPNDPIKDWGKPLGLPPPPSPKNTIKDWGKPLGLPPPPSPKNKRILVWNPVEEWGRPLGLPSPVPLVDNMDDTCADNINVELTPINDKLTPRKSAKKDVSGKTKRPDSPGKYKLKDLTKRPPTGAVYVDLAYIPHHGHTAYTNAEFFKKIRARHYVFSGIEPSRNVFNALLEAKQTWEDKDLGE